MDLSLPHYVAMERKPESGCKIQNAADGRSGIILRLEIISTADEVMKCEFEREVSHGTTVLKRLVLP